MMQLSMAHSAQRDRSLMRASFTALVLAGLVVTVGMSSFQESHHAAGTAERYSAQAGLIRIPPNPSAHIQKIPPTDAGHSGVTSADTQCAGADSDPEACVNRYVTRYIAQQGVNVEEQFCWLSPDVVNSTCGSANITNEAQCRALVDQLVNTLTQERGAIGVEAVGSTCNDLYRGQLACYQVFDTFEARAPQQVAAATAGLAQGSPARWKCCTEDDPLCKSEALKAVEAAAPNALVQLASIRQDYVGIDTARGQTSVTNVNLTETAGSAFAGGDTKQAPVHGAQSQSIANDAPAAPIPDATVASGNIQQQPTLTTGTGITSPSAAIPSAGSPNPVTARASGPIAQSTGAGVGPLSDSGNQRRYESLQTPQAQATQARAAAEAFRQLSVVERFAHFIGGTQRFVSYQSPEGIVIDVPVVEQQRRNVVFVQRHDAHIRSIEDIARDAARSDVAAGTRTEHYLHTLNVVGGPYSKGRATTTNSSFAAIQDLVVEGEAVAALSVAEDTAQRAKNTVYCRVGETSRSCIERREQVAEEVERETFVAELVRRDLPVSAVEHFVAVYDGWANPNERPPASTPVLVSGALNQPEDIQNDTATTSQPHLLARAWDGITRGATRALDALRAWVGLDLDPQVEQ